MSELMPDEEACVFFGVADGASYVPKLVTALSSIRRFHPKAHYYILGRLDDHQHSRQLIHRLGFEYVSIDLSHVFADVTSVANGKLRWPSECFCWFYAYLLFDERGFGYSCAVDGDLLCISDLDLPTVLSGTRALSSVTKKDGRINSGVVFLNNANLRVAGFFDKIVSGYKTYKVCQHATCQGFCAELPDQWLLDCLLEQEDFLCTNLHSSYNLLLPMPSEVYHARNVSIPASLDEVQILHLLAKPWRRSEVPNTYPIIREAYNLWWDFVEELWTNSEREEYFGNRAMLAGPC